MQHDIIVIGTSAGGIQALIHLLKHLPRTLPAAILVVLHRPALSSDEVLRSILQKETNLPCVSAQNGLAITPSRVYLAPPNRHMMVEQEKILLTDGPKENHYRPAVDALFRSAAVNYGSRVIGVVLTGMLQDGVAGMEAIKRCGGLGIVQQPEDAQFDSMPKSVLSNLEVDYTVPLSAMGSLLEKVVAQPASQEMTIPKDLQIEAQIAQRYLEMNSDYNLMDQLGPRVPFSCPGCGGSLWKMKNGKLDRYRCHIGHSYTGAVLFKENKESIEESLWVALRMLEDRKFMLATSQETFHQQGKEEQAQENAKRREELEKHIYSLKIVISTLNATTLAEPDEQRDRDIAS